MVVLPRANAGDPLPWTLDEAAATTDATAAGGAVAVGGAGGGTEGWAGGAPRGGGGAGPLDALVGMGRPRASGDSGADLNICVEGDNTEL